VSASLRRLGYEVRDETVDPVRPRARAPRAPRVGPRCPGTPRRRGRAGGRRRAGAQASGYSFDCFLPDLAIAVEFDGPVHFALVRPAQPSPAQQSAARPGGGVPAPRAASAAPTAHGP